MNPNPGFAEVHKPEPRFTGVCDHGPGMLVYCVDNGTRYIQDKMYILILIGLEKGNRHSTRRKNWQGHLRRDRCL